METFSALCMVTHQPVLQYTLLDSSTGSKDSGQCRCVTTAYYAPGKAIGSYFVIVYIDYSDNKITKAINTATPTTLWFCWYIATDPTSYHGVWYHSPWYYKCILPMIHQQVLVYTLSQECSMNLSAKSYRNSVRRKYGISIYADSTLNEVWVNYVRSNWYSILHTTLSFHLRVLAPASMKQWR